MTKIEWTDDSWNPVRGCTRVSEGCRNCYAERQSARNFPSHRSPTTGEAFAILTDSGPRWTGKVELIESKLVEPLHWRKPRRVFVNSMSDLFHENLSYPDILHIFQVMAKCPRHTFQILTKRPAKMRELLSLCWWRNLGHSPEMGGDVWVKVIAGEQQAGDQNFLPNVWLGVSVENQPTADERIPELLGTPAAIRFVSYEPALAEVDFLNLNNGNGWLTGRLNALTGWRIKGCGYQIPAELRGLDWGIVGGESGPGARPFNLEWARNTIRQFQAAEVPLFVKQLGSHPVSNNPADLPHLAATGKGGNPEDWPNDLRVRQFPDCRRAAAGL